MSQTLIEKIKQKADRSVKSIYPLTFKFPKYEIYALGDQIRRSLVSVPSNLFEGSSRRTYKDKLYFYRVSLGSLNEVIYQLSLAEYLGYIDKLRYKKINRELSEIGRLFYTLISRIEKDKY